MSRSFAGVRALDDVSLELHRHEVVGLIGPNGAGKSTLVNVLSGFDVPTSGQVELGEVDVTGWSPHRRGRAGIARTFQHSRSFRGLTVRENVEVAALGVGAGARAARGARGRAARAARPRRLRGGARGQRSRTATSGGSASPARSRREPAFVLLDEPAAGLPEAEVPEFAAVVRSVRDDHDAGVLLIDHNMALVMEVCDRIHVLDQGRTLAAGHAGGDPRQPRRRVGLPRRERGRGGRE